jgi:rhamnose utilization protein RhaD (predicted bifunctional aldolase and dehydrogenase)
MDAMRDLVALSRRYGADPAWVLAGGGNTSYKDASTLWIKASGSELGTIDEGGFCAIDRNRLAAIWQGDYPRDADSREAAVLADLMAARMEGDSKRPSVETLLHGLFPQAFVLHTHPSLVNGLTCGRQGEAAFRRLFSDVAIWLPFVEPGYLLAKAVREEAEAFSARKASFPSLMFMQNHGLLVAGESVAELDSLSAFVISRLESGLVRRPDQRAQIVDSQALARATARLASLAPPDAAILFRSDAEILARASGEAAFEPLSAPFTPDHIVYAGHEFLRTGLESIESAWQDCLRRNNAAPRIVLVHGLGAFAIASGPAAQSIAGKAMLLFVDACGVAAYAESFGGALHMSPAMVQFIRTWEVEKYRASMAQGGKT